MASSTYTENNGIVSVESCIYSPKTGNITSGAMNSRNFVTSYIPVLFSFLSKKILSIIKLKGRTRRGWF